MEIDPLCTRFPETYTTVKSFRTEGIRVCPALIVKFPFTIIQEDTVSFVLVNQSAAVKEEIVVVPFTVYS
jgi:hypothetical protein